MGQKATIDAINTMVVGLKADGVWDKITEAYLMAGVTFGGITVKLKERDPLGVIYESDFSVDIDWWGKNGGTVNGNVDGIGGRDDCLSFVDDGLAGFHASGRTGMTIGSTMSATVDIYFPSTNALWEGFEVRHQGATNWRNTSYHSLSAGQKDIWLTVTIPATVADGTTDQFQVIPIVSGSNNFTGNGTDVFYIRNVRVTETKAPSLTNNNFVSGDYQATGSGAGLTGDRSTKHLGTGLVRPAQGDVGYSAYVTVANTDATACFYIGAGAGGTDFSGIGRVSGGSSDGFNDAGDATGYTRASVSARDGYFTGTSRTNSDRELYRNGSSIATNGSTATTTVDTTNALELFRASSSGGRSDATITFAHIGSGLTDTDASNLSNRVNKLMEDLGCAVYVSDTSTLDSEVANYFTAVKAAGGGFGS